MVEEILETVGSIVLEGYHMVEKRIISRVERKGEGRVRDPIKRIPQIKSLFVMDVV